MANPPGYYAACHTFVETIQAIAEPFIRSSYSPASLQPFQGKISNLGIDALTLNVLGEPLYAVISTPPVVRRYNPAYVAGLNAYLNSITVDANAIGMRLTAYAALPSPHTDEAFHIMSLMMNVEISTNNFRDPFNMGFPPFLNVPALVRNPTGFAMTPPDVATPQ
jgi:hypothetical protein